MNIQDMKRLQHNLEIEIFDLLLSFELETKLHVNSILLEHVDDQIVHVTIDVRL